MFGRVPHPDARDRDYPIRSLVEAAPPPTASSRHWNANGWWGDQGATSMCVAYSWLHWLEDGPITHRGPAPLINPAEVYDEARKIDEIPGEAYDGTTVRAGAQVLRSRGFITEFRWAESVEDIVNAVLNFGPVVMGTNWYEGMMATSKTGYITPTGQVLGGHAWVINGVSLANQTVRLKNSWGRGWGSKGFALMTFIDLARLIRENGEACLALEAKP